MKNLSKLRIMLQSILVYHDLHSETIAIKNYTLLLTPLSQGIHPTAAAVVAISLQSLSLGSLLISRHNRSYNSAGWFDVISSPGDCFFILFHVKLHQYTPLATI